MNRWVLAAALSVVSLIFLSSCATDEDDPFPTHPTATSSNDEPVPGADVPGASGPHHDDPSAGWKW